MSETGKREEVTGNKTTQVYLRWVGVCAGTHFESAQDGPWDVVIHGDVITVDDFDMVELQSERTHLETSCLCSGLSLHMAEVKGGSTLGDWRPVAVAAVTMKKRGETARVEAHEEPDVCRCQCLIGGACRAVLTAYYNRNPKQLVVEKPAGDWMAFDEFLKCLGFRRARANGHPVPGMFDFLTGDSDELEKVIGIVKAGGEYLTSGNLDFTFQV